ncbi:MAG TPA: germination protein YpeB [Bacillota bacterium]|nr:germination protein YpeB [Bacillota bacterium]
MIRWLAITVLVIGLFATSLWGYQEHEEKNEILIQAENTYQRAFHELTYHLDLLHDQIGVALAVSSSERLSPQLVEIWRLTSESLANVGQLPLTLLPFNKTESFLSDIGEFTYQTAVRDLDEEPLSDEEYESLKSLYAQAEDIQTELRRVQNVVLNENLRWMDVQLALAAHDEPLDNTIIDGFKTVEEQVDEYTEGEIDSDSAIIGHSTREDSFDHLSGDQLSEDDALEKSKNLFNIEHDEQINISRSGEGANVPTYSLSYKNDQKTAYLDMTVQGGYPLTFLVNREIGEKSLSLHDGFLQAEKYLHQYDFDHLTLFESSEYNNVGVYSFIYEQDNVRILPDQIELKIALDNGDLLGMAAKNYFQNHHERELKEPELTVTEAKKFINENVDIQEEYLSVIENDFGKEILTYEILGTYDHDTYRIFINAIDGREEKVERLKHAETNYS